MHSTKKLLAAGVSACLLYTPISFAQGNPSLSLEEIIVTGRKREESLQEVPISISVLGQDFIRDAGIVDQQDLFELTPGIFYDEQIDRLSQSTNVRGVGSAEIATNRTKVTSFIDGMPVIGAPASVAIGTTRQVEIYRGPQSAAFGRSTFGGAINYISPDPTEDYEGSVAVDVNDYGRRIINGQFSGPITDNVGFLVSAEIEDSSAPSDFRSNEGVQYGERSGEAFGAKFVFTPTDALEIEFGYSTADTEDAPQVQYFITQEARDACFDGTVSVNMGTSVWQDGVFDCDWDQGAGIATQANRVPNLEAHLTSAAGAADLAAITAATYIDDNGVAQNYTLEDALFIAEAYSLPLDRFGAFDERDRFTLQVDYELDNASLIQFSAFTGEEEYIREYETSRTLDQLIGIAPNGMTGFLEVDAMGDVGAFMSDPTEIEEDYAEVRWVSPSDQRLRWVVGGSYYSSFFFTRLYTGGYSAVLQGDAAVARLDALLGNNQNPALSAGFPDPVLGEESENIGAFVNLTYDITDALTVTGEARYQVDDVSATSEGFTIQEKTTAVLPRLSVNYNATESTSIYGQVALGNNPAGVNATMLGQSFRDTLDNGIPDGGGTGNPGATAACDGSPAAIALAECNSFYVTYSADDIETFEEEELLQFEVGIKGAALDDRLQYSAAIYKIFWDNEALTTNVSWADPTVGGMAPDFQSMRGAINNGDKESQGIEFEGNFRVSDQVSLRGTFSYLDSSYEDYCDITNAGNAGLIAASGAAESTITPFGDCVVISGNTVSQQPALSGSLSPSFTTDLGNGLSLNVRGDVRYQGKQYLDFFELAELPATTTVNLSSSVRSDNWSAAIYVNNVLDDDTPRRIGGGDDYSITTDTLPALAGANSTRNILVTPQVERTIGLRLNYEF